MIRKNQILKIYGTDYKEMTKRLLAAAGLEEILADRLEGEGAGGRKKPGDLRICIKPNLVVPTPAQFGATTHPEVVAAIIEYLQERGFSSILIAESSWVGDRTSDAFEYCGFRELSEKYGVPLADVKKEASRGVDCGGLRLEVSAVLDRSDFLINVPVLKGHCQTRVTCALKNMKGLIPDKEKSRYHVMGLHDPIARLQKAVRQDFIVVDHICGDLTAEDGGNPVTCNCVMASLDPVLTDSYAAYLQGYTPDDVPYIRKAEALGIGSADLTAAEILRLQETAEETAEEETAEKTEKTDSGKTAGPAQAFVPDGEQPHTKRRMDIANAVDDIYSCSACYANLSGALIRLKEEGLLDLLDTPVSIGQGMQGRTGRLGVGRCAKDFEVCIMGCPPSPETIYEGLRAYIEHR